jgi:hypothetical protein
VIFIELLILDIFPDRGTSDVKLIWDAFREQERNDAGLLDKEISSKAGEGEGEGGAVVWDEYPLDREFERVGVGGA